MYWLSEGRVVWPSRLGTRYHFAHRAAESNGADVHAPNDALDEWVLKKMVQSEMGVCATVRALQFLQAAYFAEQMHARDGEWVDESCVEHSGIDYE